MVIIYLNITWHFPEKNVTWILMEIPCHFMSEIGASLVKIENYRISIGFGLNIDQTAVKKTWENRRHICYRVVDNLRGEIKS